MEHLSVLQFKDKLGSLTKNIRLARKKVATDKHSSLFAVTVGGEVKG